jgi:predicted transcriptional regulator with HTH domain
MDLPRTEVRRRVRQLFRQYPRASYLTEIDVLRELSDSTVQLLVKRRSKPISD